ncbi:MAG: hypothetical protein WBA13_11375 [Microcoleaceae cyanobacterium]
MKPNSETPKPKIRPILSGILFVFLVVFISFLSLNLIQALIQKFA